MIKTFTQHKKNSEEVFYIIILFLDLCEVLFASQTHGPSVTVRLTISSTRRNPPHVCVLLKHPLKGQ